MAIERLMNVSLGPSSIIQVIYLSSCSLSLSLILLPLSLFHRALSVYLPPLALPISPSSCSLGLSHLALPVSLYRSLSVSLILLPVSLSSCSLCLSHLALPPFHSTHLSLSLMNREIRRRCPSYYRIHGTSSTGEF